MNAITHSVRIAAPGDGVVVGLLAEDALEHTDETVRGTGRPEKNLLGHIDARGGAIRTRHGHAVCRVAVDQQNRVIGMAHVCPPLEWIEDHPMALRSALGRSVIELGMLAVDARHRGQGVGRSLLAAVEEDERTRGADVLFAKVAWDNWTSLRWYRDQGFTIASPGEAFLVHTPAGESNLVDRGDGHALVFKPLAAGVHILRKRRFSHSFLHLSTLPVDSSHGRWLFATGSPVAT
ncbi:GNAT family N-acetyltransferase [Streptomyces smyrnaeus]|uniref:GNAT family N-acetyltransferase n=1 Tax=Streptomyces smyrnaeus TaxID=1387713 RepID=A0ABS3Y4S3_9ACTN|nr:GNAT family N-acetyltransferase [Streptomyces smyrnaeus]MBO8202670.1 GNAT family N-acetyltransferase [Streptomyces smyrnaeus]